MLGIFALLCFAYKNKNYLDIMQKSIGPKKINTKMYNIVLLFLFPLFFAFVFVVSLTN